MHEYIIEIVRCESSIDTCNSDKVQMIEHRYLGYMMVNDNKNTRANMSNIYYMIGLSIVI